jgi:hypothetical protein
LVIEGIGLIATGHIRGIIEKAGNNQGKKVHWAKNFMDLKL